MGEAKRRGTYEERKAAAIAARHVRERHQYQGEGRTLIKVPKGPGQRELVMRIMRGMITQEQRGAG